MRYEQLDYNGKIKTLKRLHKYINKYFFNNELQEIPCDIENLSKREAVYGMFIRAAPPFPKEKISISWELEEYAEKLKTQKQQALLLGQVMLHEMIHQYCYEKGLDERENLHHGETFMKAAKQHGLISIYENDKLISERMEALTAYYLTCFRIRQ